MVLAIYFMLLGLIVGSFKNVIIYRLSEEQSIVKLSFHCPYCNTRLKVIDLIPVIRYLLTGEKCCRYCYTKISIQYPNMILLTGFSFYLLI